MWTSLFVNIPTGFLSALESALRMHPPFFVFNKDNFLFIAGKIFGISCRNRKIQGEEMVPISSKILRDEVGGRYRLYLDYLLRYKLIRTDNHYKVAKNRPDGIGKCKCYGFGVRFKGSKLEKYEIKKKSLLKRARLWDELHRRKVSKDAKLSLLNSHLGKVSLDLPLAEFLLWQKVKSGEYTTKKANVEIEKCRRIAEGDYFITRDIYGRVHTNLTNLAKCVRDVCLSIDGERVTGIDIRSSQPTLLYSMIMSHYEEMSREIHEKYHVSMAIADGYHNFEGPSAFGTISSMYKKSGYNSPEAYLQAFQAELVKMRGFLEKDIYDQFSLWWSFYNGEVLPRKRIKKKWFGYVFGEVGKRDLKMEHIWRREFPLIDKIIDVIKAPDYCILARLLQERESQIVIGDLCGEVDKQFDAPYFTVHDSIFVKNSMVDEVRPIFERVLERNQVVSGLVVG